MGDNKISVGDLVRTCDGGNYCIVLKIHDKAGAVLHYLLHDINDKSQLWRSEEQIIQPVFGHTDNSSYVSFV